MDRQLELLVWNRAGHVCEYCRMPQAFDDLTFEVDHIIAVAHGGATISANLALSCYQCNRFKGPNLAGIDPRTGQLSKLFHPRRHVWKRHFRWNNAIMTGLTPIGRATVRVLHVNDVLRVKLRAQLISEGAIELD